MTSVPTTPDFLPRITIVGGGFGGLAAARELKKTRARVDLIDKTNHHVFQPLLYQVATGPRDAYAAPSEKPCSVFALHSAQRAAKEILLHTSKKLVIAIAHR